jgi:hypothetical protein
MTHTTTRLRSRSWLLALIPLALACGRVASDDASDGAGGGAPSDASSDDGGPTPGGDCDQPNASAPSDDGCNSCTCSTAGEWLCSDTVCPDPECEEGDGMSDGCNSCTCLDGVWTCTERDCGSECTAGDEKVADDGCNTCTCTDDGYWACTEIGCIDPPCGGIAGLTCDDADAYCHYDLPGHCGAGDVQGACRTRPTACTKEAVPVCGCDGNDYSNACEANAAGTSVAAEGQCITQ